MTLKKIDIFKYQDYRKYLSDTFDQRKLDEPSHTLGKWAREIGISSVSGLTMIINGQRNAGKAMREKLIINLKLSIEQAAYLKKLIQIQKQAKDDKNLVIYMMSNENEDNQQVDVDRPIHFKWQMGFIREASKWTDFNKSQEWLGGHCQLSYGSGELESCVDEMQELGILEYQNGALKQNKEYSPKNVDMKYFKHLHNDFLRIAKESYALNMDLRTLEYRMLMIKKSDVKKVKERIMEYADMLIAEFDQVESNSDESQIYLTSFYLLPFSK